MAVCFAAFLFTGCGKEETPEEDTKISEQTEGDSVEAADEKQPEESTEPEAEETEEAKAQEVNNLPKAGLKKNIIITIIGVFVLAIIFKIK